MTVRRAILMSASAATLTLVIHANAWSASPEYKPALPTATPTAGSPTPGPGAGLGSPSITGEKPSTSPEITLTTPPKPDTAAPRSPASPQIPMWATRRNQLGSMPREERNAQREQRFREMRERAMQRHRKVREEAERWESYWKILDAMTPKQKEAIYAIFDPEHKGCARRTTGHRMPPPMPTMPKSPYMDQHDFNPFFPGPDYGPQYNRPYPFERQVP